MAKRKKSWQKEPEQIEKRRVKGNARSAAYQQEKLEKGMLARNTALNKMGYNLNGAGHVEVYKTETQAARLQDYYGIEPTPAPIKTIDASVDPPEIIEYPERPGANELEQVDNLPASEPAALPRITAQFDAQAGLIAKRMRRARAVLRTAIGNSPRITMKHGP